MRRAWSLLLAALAMSCGGKVYLDVPDAGGSGGVGGSGAGGSGVGGSGATVPSTGSVGDGGGIGGDLPGCVHCGEFLADPTLGIGQFCASSQPIYDTMHTCICETTCASLCAANVCEGFSLDVPCSKCLEDPSMDGCGVPYNACGNDV
jgi:hypothetical protein